MREYFDLAERTVMTFIQCFAALMVANEANILYNIDTLEAATCGGMASALAVLKGFATQKLSKDKTPSVVATAPVKKTPAKKAPAKKK